MKSCFNHWPEIAARIHSALGLFIALDYDGVLSPIAPRPELAIMPERTRALLKRLVQQPNVTVAVVSGRPLEDVRQHVGLEAIFYAGNHGAEIELHDAVERHIALGHYRQHLVAVRNEWETWLLDFPGLLIEDKGFGIGLHYRELASARHSEFQKRFAAWSEHLSADLKVLPAKMMYEVRPRVDWNKGNAVLRLWEALAAQALPFCLGDDHTDEDGFLALQGRGINIFVGRGTQSYADYFLNSSEDVPLFLERLIDEVGHISQNKPLINS